MDFENYKIPENYEEAVARKKELQEKINSYSEAELLGNPLPYTEEEVDDFQEEFEYLDSHLKLTKEEKLQKLDAKDIKVNEDGTIEKVEHKLDKVHWPVFFYPLVLIFFALFNLMFSTGITTGINDWFDHYLQLAYDNNIASQSFTASAYMWKDSSAIFNTIINCIWLPIAMVVVAVIIYYLYKKVFKKNEVNAKIAFIVILIVAVAAIVCMTITLITYIKMTLSYADSAESLYSAYKAIQESLES